MGHVEGHKLINQVNEHREKFMASYRDELHDIEEQLRARVREVDAKVAATCNALQSRIAHVADSGPAGDFEDSDGEDEASVSSEDPEPRPERAPAAPPTRRLAAGRRMNTVKERAAMDDRL